MGNSPIKFCSIADMQKGAYRARKVLGESSQALTDFSLVLTLVDKYTLWVYFKSVSAVIKSYWQVSF